MRRLTRFTQVALLCVTGFLITSCSHMPRVMEETDSVLTIRNEYLRTHPDGRFNESIMAGEVCKGMNFIEVLAAWGLPETRFRSADDDIEFWKYVSRDDVSLDWMSYTFAFEKNALVGWESFRHTGKFARMDYFEQDVPGDELFRPRSGVMTDVSSIRK